MDHANRSRWRSLLVFYARRFLRIFPLYYLVVLASAILAVKPAREYLVYLLTYTLNFKMISQGWYVNHFAHFWSLCVEEHFYLIWPWIVLFVPRSRLAMAGMSLIGVAMGTRAFLWIGWRYLGFKLSGLSSDIFTLACFDTLGLGCLVSILAHTQLGSRNLMQMMNRIALPVGTVGLLALWLPISPAYSPPYWIVFHDLFAGLIFAWLVLGAANGFKGPVGWFLSLAPIRYLGRISYGVYVYHPLVPDMLRWAVSKVGGTFEETSVVGFIIATGSAIGLSALSWHAFERPINRLKMHFIA